MFAASIALDAGLVLFGRELGRVGWLAQRHSRGLPIITRTGGTRSRPSPFLGLAAASPMVSRGKYWNLRREDLGLVSEGTVDFVVRARL